MEDIKPLHEVGLVKIVAETYISHDGKILMQKRSNSSKRFPGFWAGPGGHVDEGEDVLTAAIREVKEEAGVEISGKDIKLKVIASHNHLNLNEIFFCFVFLATIPTFQEVAEPTEEGEPKWIPIRELLKMDNVFPPASYYFDHVLNDKPGILYTSVDWENSQLVKCRSQKLGQLQY